jgi:hypothetical protein
MNTRVFSLRSEITLQNSGPDNLTFQVEISGWTITDTNGVLQFIENMQPVYPNEPNYVKAWRFTDLYITYGNPLTEKDWQHCPALMVNSIGLGECDDYAEILAVLWQDLGYNSRVWYLSGHVVSEVQVNGQWMLYDAGYGGEGVYYYLSDGKTIASVTDLENNGSLITNPVNPIDPRGDPVYSAELAGIYTSINNNSIDGFDCPDTTGPAPNFELPAGAQMTIGNSLLTITLPAGWSGTIAEPLVVKSITGDIISYDGNPVTENTIGGIINTEATYIHELQFEKSSTKAVITYILNPHVIPMIFTLTVKGENLDELTEIFG